MKYVESNRQRHKFSSGDGELGAAIRYLSQKYTMVTPEAKAILNDIGTEELAHLEMIGAMVAQLTQGANAEDMKKAGLDPYYTDHGAGIFPQSAAGIPWSATGIQSSGNPVADLYEDMAAEQKAKKTYQYLLDQLDDPDVIDPLRFLREREIVHFQRFGEALRYVEDYMSAKRIFY